jgi:hypothetical protein
MSRTSIGKTALERGLELAQKHPEEFRMAYIQDFINKTPWTQVDKYIGLLGSHGIYFDPVTTRMKIEEATYFALHSLGKGDRQITKGGDRDDINELEVPNVLLGGEKKKEAYRKAVSNGALIETIMEKKGVLDGGQTFQNGKDLLEQGVKVYCIDDPLYAAVTVGPEISSLVWESVQIDPSFVRSEGFSEPDGKVRRTGYYLDGKHDGQEQFSNALLSSLDEMKKKATPFEELEVEVERKKSNSMLSLITNGKSSSLKV